MVRQGKAIAIRRQRHRRLPPSAPGPFRVRVREIPGLLLPPRDAGPRLRSQVLSDVSRGTFPLSSRPVRDDRNRAVAPGNGARPLRQPARRMSRSRVPPPGSVALPARGRRSAGRRTRPPRPGPAGLARSLSGPARGRPRDEGGRVTVGGVPRGRNRGAGNERGSCGATGVARASSPCRGRSHGQDARATRGIPPVPHINHESLSSTAGRHRPGRRRRRAPARRVSLLRFPLLASTSTLGASSSREDRDSIPSCRFRGAQAGAHSLVGVNAWN